MNEITSYKYCEDTIKLKQSIEVSYVALCERLYKIRNERLYEAQFADWDVFLEEIKIDRASADKMCRIYELFVLNYKVPAEKIAEVGGWSKVAELLPVSTNKKQAIEALEYAKGALKKDVRIYVKEILGKQIPDNCKHKNTYVVEICKNCGDKHVIVIN